MSPRLDWVPELLGCLGRATWGQVQSATIRTTADPLKIQVALKVDQLFSREDYGHVERLAWAFAKANDCWLEKMTRSGQLEYSLLVLTKRRLGPSMRKNPLLV